MYLQIFTIDGFNLHRKRGQGFDELRSRLVRRYRHEVLYQNALKGCRIFRLKRSPECALYVNHVVLHHGATPFIYERAFPNSLRMESLKPGNTSPPSNVSSMVNVRGGCPGAYTSMLSDFGYISHSKIPALR